MIPCFASFTLLLLLLSVRVGGLLQLHHLLLQRLLCLLQLGLLRCTKRMSDNDVDMT